MSFRIFCLLTPLMILCTGCSSESIPEMPEYGEEGAKISTIVEGMIENGSRMDYLKTTFASGTKFTTKDRRKYAGFLFYVKSPESIAINGNSATATIIIDDNSGSKKEVEWTFIKEGEQWKIKSAPTS